MLNNLRPPFSVYSQNYVTNKIFSANAFCMKAKKEKCTTRFKDNSRDKRGNGCRIIMIASILARAWHLQGERE